jgi:hypothetical protein
MPKDFLKGFEEEPVPSGLVEPTDNVCPPVPTTTKVSAEGRANYATLQPNSANGYGMTGLMAVNTWQTACYGEVRPGYIFLFPGTYNPPAAYQGTVSLNCQAHAPLNSSGGTLHAQMCTILGQPTTNFIGFSCKYPFTASGNMVYHSVTCNVYWFGGSNEVSQNCDGTNWQQIIYNALLAWLPGALTAIRIQNRYFFTAANNGGLGTGQNVAIRTDARVVGPNEKFNIVPTNTTAGQFALRTSGGHYVTAVNNGGMGGPNDSTSPIHTDAVAQGPGETFAFERQPDGSYAIRTTTGYYLSAVNGGGWGEAANRFPVHTDASAIGPWETFTFVGATPPA